MLLFSAFQPIAGQGIAVFVRWCHRSKLAWSVAILERVESKPPMAGVAWGWQRHRGGIVFWLECSLLS